MRKNKLLLLLALLMTAATGAWAQSAFTAKGITSASQLTSTDDEAYVAACMPSDFLAVDVNVAKAWTGAPTDGSATLIYAIDGDKIKIATFLNGSNKTTTGATWSIATFKNQLSNSKFFYTAASPYSVTMKDGVKDADKWTVKVGEGQAQALPIGGLTGDGKETVTLQYNGRLKVKGVTATSDEAAKPAAEGHALSASAVGEIVGSDGKAYAAADKDNLPKGVKAEALVCYVDGENGLALAMADVKDAKMSWDNNRGANDGKTAAEWCTGWNTSHPITGATWLLASKTQWNNMISAAGGASNLSNAFSAVGGTNLQAFSYWSSTPNIGTSAWRYYFPSSSWSWTYLNQDNTGSFIRACLAF